LQSLFVDDLRECHACRGHHGGKVRGLLGADLAATKPRLVAVRDEAEQAGYIVEQVLENREQGTLLKQQAAASPGSAARNPSQGPRIDVGARIRGMWRYLITCCIRQDEPEFRRSSDREGILELLFDLDLVELRVEKNGKRSWLMLSFGESGWDVVADYSVDLEGIIDPIVEPYYDQAVDPGFAIIALPTPDELDRGEPSAMAAFDGFVQTMERLKS
jgi:hypothetical protein